jgi:Septum formation
MERDVAAPYRLGEMSGPHPNPTQWQWAPPPPPPPQQSRTDWVPVVLAAVIASVAGLVVGGLLGGLVAMGIDIAGRFDPDPLTYGPGGALARFELEAGQCADGELAEGNGFGAEAAVSCSGSHDFEVYAQTSSPGQQQSNRFPDSRALASFSDDYCLMALEAFVGGDYDSSSYDYASIVPTRAAWDSGDRRVICALFDYDGNPITGSARATEA